MINTLLRSCHVYQLLLVLALSVHINVSLFSSSAFTYWLYSGPWLSTGTNICQKRSILRTPPKKMVMPPLFLLFSSSIHTKRDKKSPGFHFLHESVRMGALPRGSLDKEERFAFSFHWRVIGEFCIFLLVVFQQSSHGHQDTNAPRSYSTVRVNFIPIPLSV